MFKHILATIDTHSVPYTPSALSIYYHNKHFLRVVYGLNAHLSGCKNQSSLITETDVFRL